MSRIGRKPVAVPQGVTVQIGDGQLLVKGPKGETTCVVPPGIHFDLEGTTLLARTSGDDKELSPMHGLARSLAFNAVNGVLNGYSKNLEIYGVGFKAQKKGDTIVFSLGFSHPIEYPIPAGINIVIDEKQTKLSVSGPDKHLVGQVAAHIRRMRPPDPYKNKGVRYAGEHLKKKAGKTGTK